MRQRYHPSSLSTWVHWWCWAVLLLGAAASYHPSIIEIFRSCPANSSIEGPTTDAEMESMMLLDYSCIMLEVYSNQLVSIDNHTLMDKVIQYHTDRNETFSVLFYAPPEWCKFSRAMIHLLHRLLGELKMPIYALNAHQHPDLNYRFGVHAFPSLVLIIDGAKQQYYGRTELLSVSKWYRLYRKPEKQTLVRRDVCMLSATAPYYPRYPPFVDRYKTLEPSDYEDRSPDPYLYFSVVYVIGFAVYSLFRLKSALFSFVRVTKEALKEWKIV